MLLHGFGWEVPGGLASTTCWITYTSDRSTIFTPIFTPTLDVTALYIGLTVSRAVCRALQLYSSRYASTALQLYNALHSTTSAPTLWSVILAVSSRAQ